MSLQKLKTYRGLLLQNILESGGECIWKNTLGDKVQNMVRQPKTQKNILILLRKMVLTEFWLKDGMKVGMVTGLQMVLHLVL
ncbi:hypothetical protein D9M71_725770 [compost metagenome]